MTEMEEAKRRYNEIPIPKELSERVMLEIQRAEEKQKKIVTMQIERQETWKKAQRKLQKGIAAAAVIMIVFTTAVNTNTTFAETVQAIPIIGSVARVLTIRSYQTETKDWDISVQIPSIESISTEFKGLAESVNQEIYQLCEQYAQGGIERANAYKKAFLDTGGTEEEWKAHNIEIRVWYEVKSQTENYLSLEILGSENWNTANHETKYYNFDLNKGVQISLEDVLGQEYDKIAEESVWQQMEERELNQGQQYWDEFAGVDETTKFYMNEAGNPVIVFDKYEVASGAAGEQEFEIVK